jgi:hypothetical protein
VMGRTSHALGILSPGAPKDKRFREFFGVSTEVAVKAWGMMEEHDLLPSTPQFFHYLWALAFMQTYPPQRYNSLEVVVGSDPKTIYKYIWPFIKSLSELDYFVVS